MTIVNVNLASLKKVKNSIIGNPSAKLQLARDEIFVRTLIECLNYPALLLHESQGSQDDIRIEAAHVISSLSYGSEEALASLLRFQAPRACLYAISKFQPSDSIPLRSAFARALRALTVSISDAVGPSQWGLRSEKSVIRNEAEGALEYLFHLDSLDTYLPLLIDTSPQTSTSIAQLLASAVRTPDRRAAISEWVPPIGRITEVKARRGWEKTAATNANSPTRQGGWVARNLTALLRSRDGKLQEAALLALASLSKENHSVASVLAKTPPDRDVPSPLSAVLSMSKSRSTDVQLAACLCATHILRGSSVAGHSSPTDSTCARTIMNIVNRMLSTSSSDTSQHRTKACFILFYLVNDDTALCQTAFDRGCLEKLAALIQSITPSGNSTEWDEDEAESISSLREAALTAIAAISLFDNDIRRAVTDDLRLLAIIHSSLSHRHIGIRYAACQCVRALSRAVAVLRTNIVDSGLGLSVFKIFAKEDEDRRVLSAALSAVCNIVNEFSPLRPIYLDMGLMPRLVQLIHSDHTALRLGALWAVKNLLRKTSAETKQNVMSHLSWQHLAVLLVDPNDGIQEQAFSIIRNLAENEQGIDMIFRELSMDVLLNSLTTSLRSSAEDVVLQAAYALANLANGRESQRNYMFAHPKVLESLQACLAASKTDIRRPAVACVLELARASPHMNKVLADAGFVSTLRHMCEWSGVARSPVGGRPGTHNSTIEDDSDVIDSARIAVEWLEGHI